MGSGHFFWKDKWVDDVSLGVKYHKLFYLVVDKDKIGGRNV
jgi:hypothetical protein